ncbi:winged helix-turn-helix transcriptional regulator [Candidatus Saccharibacteria bacterium]|nr:winged helix-turn-helix transcriptional regulator [Candidatus Saccharibacteria bacterium]
MQIESLFGSKTRVKLLSLFYNNPERPFYVREITRKINEQINSVRRELQNLLNIGIVQSVNQSNRLYYEVDPSFKFHSELMSIFQRIPAKSKAIRETKEEDQIVKKIQKAGNVKVLFLSGAFVRGSMQNIDIFIVGDMNKAKLAQIIVEMEAAMNRELNYTTLRVEDFDYRRNLNDRFILDMLDAKKIVLKDELKIFQGKSQPTQSSSHEAAKPPVTVNISEPNPTITTEEAMRIAQLNSD